MTQNKDLLAGILWNFSLRELNFPEDFKLEVKRYNEAILGRAFTKGWNEVIIKSQKL
jgi:hypothetical protein